MESVNPGCYFSCYTDICDFYVGHHNNCDDVNQYVDTSR